MSGPDMIVALALFGGGTYVLRGVIGVIGKSIDAKHRPAITSDAEQRLERMEQAIDAIAVEVERIAEGQRFTTRLLAEREPGNVLPANKPSVQS